MRIVGTALVAGTISVTFLLAPGGWIAAGTEQSAEVEKPTLPTRDEVWSAYSHFRDFQGIKVENVDGEKIGTVNDLIIELRSGMPQYVIVSSGRFVVGHRRSVIVPISAIALRTAKAGIAAVDITRGQWKYAPEFSRKDLEWIGRPEKARQIARFYGRAEEAPGLAKSNAQTRRSDLSPAGRVAEQTSRPNQRGGYQLASELIGYEVIARQQLEVGRISDFLVDAAEMTPAFAIVSASRSTSTSFAVPVQMLRSLPGNRVAISANREDFEHARAFREGETSAGRQSDEIYRYER
jgi:sporulation protein YlmC with PRC-barrel domain